MKHELNRDMDGNIEYENHLYRFGNGVKDYTCHKCNITYNMRSVYKIPVYIDNVPICANCIDKNKKDYIVGYKIERYYYGDWLKEIYPWFLRNYDDIEKIKHPPELIIDCVEIRDLMSEKISNWLDENGY